MASCTAMRDRLSWRSVRRTLGTPSCLSAGYAQRHFLVSSTSDSAFLSERCPGSCRTASTRCLSEASVRSHHSFSGWCWPQIETIPRKPDHMLLHFSPKLPANCFALIEDFCCLFSFVFAIGTACASIWLMDLIVLGLRALAGLCPRRRAHPWS